jgi:hypothetical protein
MRGFVRQIEWDSVLTIAIGALLIVFLIWFAVVMWDSGKRGPMSSANTGPDRVKLEKYNRWGEGLHSGNPEKMRETMKEMQREHFSEKDLEEYKRLRDKYKN